MVRPTSIIALVFARIDLAPAVQVGFFDTFTQGSDLGDLRDLEDRLDALVN